MWLSSFSEDLQMNNQQQAIEKYFSGLLDFVTNKAENLPNYECPAHSREEAIEALTLGGWYDPESGADLEDWR